MERQQDDICCLSNDERQSSHNVPCAETGKTIQIQMTANVLLLG